MAETIHQLKHGDEPIEIPCATYGCGYNVTYNPKKKPTDALTEYRYGDIITTVFLECDKPYDSHTNKYKIKKSNYG